MSAQEVFRTGCCEPFDPGPWQDKEITWKDKVFVKDRVKSVAHIPVNMGKVVTKNMALIEKANAKAPYQMMLVDEKSAWGEGPYQDAGKWAEEMKGYVSSQGKNLKKMYFSYTTCPNCAKAYGKNYVVLFAQVN